MHDCAREGCNRGEQRTDSRVRGRSGLGPVLGDNGLARAIWRGDSHGKAALGVTWGRAKLDSPV